MCAHRPTVSERLVSPADWLEATGAGTGRHSPGVRGHTGYTQWKVGFRARFTTTKLFQLVGIINVLSWVVICKISFFWCFINYGGLIDFMATWIKFWG